MKRYYFHLMDGHDVIPDRTGVEIADLAAASDEALEAIQQFRQEHPATADEWQDWRIEVTDAWGAIALTVGLGDGEFPGIAPAGPEQAIRPAQ